MPEGALDNARLGVLADALRDAGCDSEEILAPQQTRSPRCFPVAPAFPARSHIRMSSIPTPDESFARLHRAG